MNIILVFAENIKVVNYTIFKSIIMVILCFKKNYSSKKKKKLVDINNVYYIFILKIN